MTLSTRIPYPLFLVCWLHHFQRFLGRGCRGSWRDHPPFGSPLDASCERPEPCQQPSVSGLPWAQTFWNEEFLRRAAAKRAITSLFISSLRPLQQQQNVEKTQNGDRSFEQEKPRFIELGNHESI